MMKKILVLGICVTVFCGCMQIKSAFGYHSSSNIHKFEVRRPFVYDGDMSEIVKAIKAGAGDRGWMVADVSDGCVRVVLDYHGGRRRLELDVIYDNKGYCFKYVSSHRLAYDADTGNIHPKALSWAGYLSDSINARIATLYGDAAGRSQTSAEVQ